MAISPSFVRYFLPACMWVILALATAHSEAARQTHSGPEKAAALLVDLESAVAKADWARVTELRTAVGQLGPETLPLILDRMTRKEVGPNVKIHLFETLRQIPGEETIETMLDLTLHNTDPELVRMADAAIPREYVLKRDLSEQDQAILISKVRGEARVAEKWAVLLAHAKHVDQDRVINAFVDRFSRAVATPVEQRNAAHRGSYLSREGFEMGEFLWVFPSLDARKSLPLLQKATESAQHKESTRWWLMARGMSGEKAVAGELETILQSTSEDVSVRALALRAYAYALNDEAVPLLHAYVDDTTPGPSPFGAPLEIVAREQLLRIQRR